MCSSILKIGDRRNFSLCENPLKKISKSFTINQSHFLACTDANDTIAEYLQNLKMCYMGYFLQINCYFWFFYTSDDYNLSSAIAELLKYCSVRSKLRLAGNCICHFHFLILQFSHLRFKNFVLRNNSRRYSESEILRTSWLFQYEWFMIHASIKPANTSSQQKMWRRPT